MYFFLLNLLDCTVSDDYIYMSVRLSVFNTVVSYLYYLLTFSTSSIHICMRAFVRVYVYVYWRVCISIYTDMLFLFYCKVMRMYFETTTCFSVRSYFIPEHHLTERIIVRASSQHLTTHRSCTIFRARSLFSILLTCISKSPCNFAFNFVCNFCFVLFFRLFILYLFIYLFYCLLVFYFITLGLVDINIDSMFSKRFDNFSSHVTYNFVLYTSWIAYENEYPYILPFSFFFFFLNAVVIAMSLKL